MGRIPKKQDRELSKALSLASGEVPISASEPEPEVPIGPETEPHCPVCMALPRFCPGHDPAGLPVRGRNIEAPFLLTGRRERLELQANPYNVAATSSKGLFGYFETDPIARWSSDGVRMVLMKDFAYIDKRHRRWLAPAGTITDGASIPRIFWMIVGAPLTGKYRYSAIVHDHYCQSQDEAWQDVHTMFFEGCIAGGCTVKHAKILFYAVWHFGPRWGVNVHQVKSGVTSAPLYEPRVLALVEGFINSGVSLDEIKSTDPYTLGFPRYTSKRR